MMPMLRRCFAKPGYDGGPQRQDCCVWFVSCVFILLPLNWSHSLATSHCLVFLVLAGRHCVYTILMMDTEVKKLIVDVH